MTIARLVRPEIRALQPYAAAEQVDHQPNIVQNSGKRIVDFMNHTGGKLSQ